MMHDILEQALERRTWEVVALCEEKNDETYKSLVAVLKKLRNHVPLELIDELNSIEDLFVQKNTDVVIMAHQMGINDYRNFINKFKNYCS
ncbi:hypothetical protein J41TS12_17240 [Paenibacillus antibioticophila]|uniref:Uncharacterized protein n=1 Tax=Paenibacillus antibioticophila TaxID=1274374 RepID=A0A919XSQ2_9BACL|nr:hypothetical protein [Paenibacillus antibioticophila]GIO36863.1 hypothetical protein J41TS12_17240 [Paenibacillus antibioticophila]